MASRLPLTPKILTSTSQLILSITLASAGSSVINRPNIDTLYSEAIVDLSSYDLVVTIPDVPEGRFYVFPFYDLYGDNFANNEKQVRSLPRRLPSPPMA